MRAISLWQPWASAVALGSKTIETRHWSTYYRGPLAIHAAKRCNKNELLVFGCSWNWKGALRFGLDGDSNKYLWDVLPFGSIVAVANLVDCRPVESLTLGLIRARHRLAIQHGDLYEWTEEQMGNYEPGRFGWILDDIRPLEKPIPFKGAQGFFNVPDSLLRAA